MRKMIVTPCTPLLEHTLKWAAHRNWDNNKICPAETENHIFWGMADVLAMFSLE